QTCVQRSEIQTTMQDRRSEFDQLGEAGSTGRLLLFRLPTSVRREVGRRKLYGTFRKLRKHLRRSCLAHDGTSNIPTSPCDQRKRRARRVFPHRRVSRPKPI